MSETDLFQLRNGQYILSEELSAKMYYIKNALIPESPALIKIDASLIVRQKLFDLVGRSVRCEVNFVAVYLAGGEHCSYNGITLFVDGRNERRLLLGDKLKQL